MNTKGDMEKEQIQEELLDFITQNFMIDREDIDINKSMIDEGIIDSFGLIEIATFIEEEYSLLVDEDDMIRENFGSVVKIVNFIFVKRFDENIQ